MEATFYFLEALDEAAPEVQLDLLEKLSTLDVKLFITSRPLAALEARFPSAHRFPIFAQDRDLDLHISKEISRSIVLQSVLDQPGSTLRAKIASTVKQKCGGMQVFLFLLWESSLLTLLQVSTCCAPVRCSPGLRKCTRCGDDTRGVSSTDWGCLQANVGSHPRLSPEDGYSGKEHPCVDPLRDEIVDHGAAATFHGELSRDA